ncbi:hypothetical protein RND71_018223 [Anisodus tanguticus]|uniref:Uncharacterized protein n=1 Tax=Anisodus tanguticus TaxID=243964 RepID=A0AAE1S4C1_9SOLA|nr:hypothetical protein RND71_018223 [Anisodus tanguticus]
MEPPEICKMVGRPKVKRGGVRNENLKRHGVWSSSRKGKPMTWKQAATPSRLVDDPIVKRFKGSSSTTIVLESEDNFPSSSCTTTVLELDPSLRSKSFFEANTRILERMKKPLATPTRRILFVGDSTGMSQLTNMPYQPSN